MPGAATVLAIPSACVRDPERSEKDVNPSTNDTERTR